MGSPEVAPRRIAVIGGGITGTSCALFLCRDGHEVTLFERGDPAAGTSSGNAGVISVGGCVPTATPAVLQRVPQMLFDPHGPLAIRWRHLPQLTPWLLAFMWNARRGAVATNARAKAALLDHAMAAYDTLVALSDAELLINRNGMLRVYGSEASFRRAQFDLDLMARCGRRLEVVEAGQIRQLEPALAPVFTHGVLHDDNANIRHPGRLVTRFADAFRAMGGTVLPESVECISTAAPRVVRTDRAERTFDAVVVAAGAWSARLVAMVGCRILLDAERGYHAMMPHPERTLSRPVTLADHSIFLSPMEHGLRLTAGVELASIEAPPDYTRVRRMLAVAQAAVRGLDAREESVWLGFRPSTPSGVPYLGALPGQPDVFLAAGGGHVGMTMGPVSGRVVADLVAGRAPGIDLAPYRVDR